MVNRQKYLFTIHTTNSFLLFSLSSFLFLISHTLSLFLSHFLPYKIIFKENKEYNRESVGESIEKTVAKVESCTFFLTTLAIIVGDALMFIYCSY